LFFNGIAIFSKIYYYYLLIKIIYNIGKIFIIIFIIFLRGLGIGDWGLGFWVLGVGAIAPNPKPKTPTPQTHKP